MEAVLDVAQSRTLMSMVEEVGRIDELCTWWAWWRRKDSIEISRAGSSRFPAKGDGCKDEGSLERSEG